MARRARGAATAKEQDLPVLAALRFVAVAQHEDGVPYQTNCRFTGTEVIAFDGILAAGYPCTEIMDACPHTLDTIAAISRLRGAYSMTLLDRNKLIINSEKYRVVINCLAPIDVDSVVSIPMQYPLNDDFKRAAADAGSFITEKAESVMASSLYSLDGSILGTNGKIILECWHGNPFPPGLIIPYTAIRALNKIEQHLIGFGYDTNAITFFFENGAWLRTQLFQSDYPRVENLRLQMDKMICTPKPDELEKAVNHVLPFSDNNGVWITSNLVKSHGNDNATAQYKCAGLPFEVSFNGDYFLKTANLITSMDFTSNANLIMFQGNRIRGAMTMYG